MIGIGVIGYGYWGPNLVRNFQELPDFRLVSICDVDARRRELATSRCPGVRVVSDAEVLLTDSRVEAVAIATSVASHFGLALAALQANKHVLVEKPLAGTSEHAARLIDEARRRQRVLMVDHTYLHTAAVRKIRDLIDAEDLGELYYFDSARVNLGLFRHDVNVLWDLAVHDLAIMDYLLPAQPQAVSAVAMRHVPGELENMAYLTFFFPGRLLAHVHVNWLAPVKLRSTLVAGSRKMVVYNDLEPSDKVKVYDKGVSLTDDAELIRDLRINYRTGDMRAPFLATTEALSTELAHFAECIREGHTPLSDGQSGLRIVRWLEAADRSCAARGTPVEIDTSEVTT